MSGKTFWLASCIHQDEEELIINTFKILRSKWPNLVLLLAPRHIDRAKEIFRLAHGFKIQLRSEVSIPGQEVDIYVIDTFGELGLFYAFSDFVVLGGSFCNVGGHNILEPILLKCAVIHGPDMTNNQDVAEAFADACFVVTKSGLADAVERFLINPELAKGLSEQAYKLCCSYKEKVDEMMEVLLKQVANDVGFGINRNVA